MNIQKGKTPRPRKTLLYGTQGIGKSTWANNMLDTVFIQTEEGLNDIDCSKFELATSYADIEEAIGQLCKEDHPYKTLAIDTLDWLEPLIVKKACHDLSVDSIGDAGHGKGYVRAFEIWRTLLNALEYLQKTKDMHVIFLAHSKIEKFDDPAGEQFDKYSPKLQKSPNAAVQEWCDEVFFAKYSVITKEVQSGFSKKEKAVDNQGKRTMYTQERPAFYAKNRLNMPVEVDFLASVYLLAIQDNFKKGSK